MKAGQSRLPLTASPADDELYQIIILFIQKQAQVDPSLSDPVPAGGRIGRIRYGGMKNHCSTTALICRPRTSGRALGGMVKLYWLDEIWPNSRTGFNLLYTVSSTLQPEWPALCWSAKRRGARRWSSIRTEPITLAVAPVICPRPIDLLKKAIENADYIFYQSEFCKRSADKWVAQPDCDWEILYNAVGHGPVPTVG